ncbi:hypothetical protein K6V98_02860 [Collinsella sp. AGMB00827]|uniref:Uncharacterized protein n=1 Tax=Collinsella ureilytica TaxID=2869515 RepID=A0ABS7MIW4_9ACTN|nr:hypothetical protein [Collinsella urealyticum]MBY4797306.1 hypothetical protein [Collinsella urealyticum]
MGDSIIEGLDEAFPVLFAVLASKYNLGLEHAPEIVDVVLAAPVVIGEGIEGRVEVVEHGDALEVFGLLCLDVECLGDACNDLLPACVLDALVKEAEDGERINIAQLIRLELGQLHSNRFIDGC